MRLRHLFTGEVTHRELINLIRHLPVESATARELYGDQVIWTPEMHRLTDIADLLLIANWQRSESTATPTLLPRPGRDEQPDASQADGDEVLTMAEFDERMFGG